LAENIGSIVDLVHPTVSGVGIITSDQIWVLFDREIDETTVEGGNFFAAGPDFDTWSGPDLQLFHDFASSGSEDEILQSPGFEGLLQGNITFERIDLSDDDTVVTTTDTVGSGLLYRTKAIFTPTNRLATDTNYTVYLSGDEDETDDLTTGVSERTVFDTIASGLNTGDGEAEFTGSYTGQATQDTYYAQISTAGELGDARFQYWKGTAPLSVFGPFKAKRSGTLLSNGVYIEFEEGTYQSGDIWSAIVKEKVSFSGNLNWPFMTGSGSIDAIPSTAATSVLGDTVTTTGTTSSSSSSSFSVSSTSPADGISHMDVPVEDYTLTATFSSSIDASTVDTSTVTVFTEPVNGDPLITASGTLLVSPSATGSVLSIVVASGQLLTNNLVTVTLDSTIASSVGTALGSDYTWEFTTTYSPYYCTLRRIRLDVGAFIDGVADDTVNFAIFQASQEADENNWNASPDSSSYYQFVRSMWTCCRAQETLLINTTGGSNRLKSKQLGDLKVEYNSSGDVSAPLSRALECMAKWENSLRSGGMTVQKASMVVKGELDADRPYAGRGWYMAGTMPAANAKIRLSGSRRYRKAYYTRYRKGKNGY